MGIAWETFLGENSQFYSDKIHTFMKGVNTMGLIYSFTNTINNKKYIGQTINSTKERYYNHKSAYKNEKSCDYNSPLHRAFRKYGFDNFEY